MKQLFFSAVIAAGLLAAPRTQAQYGYNFSVLANQPYTPLVGATSLTQNTVWDASSTFSLLVPFAFNVNGVFGSSLTLFGGGLLTNSAISPINGFSPMAFGLMDRSVIPGLPKSEIRYLTTGSPGARTFKIEIANAGFEDEYDNMNTLNDSVSFQIWLHESTGITEFLYGPSQVTDFTMFGYKMLTGIITGLDTNTGSFTKFYIANSVGGSIVLDSITNLLQHKGLTALPASGTMFRFSPTWLPTSVGGEPTDNRVARVFPTAGDGTVIIERPDPMQYVLQSMDGKALREGQLPSGVSSLQLLPDAGGVYLLRLTNLTTRTATCYRLLRQ